MRNVMLAVLLGWFIVMALAIYGALAQSGSYYGPTGEYLGSFHRQGPNTTYQGPAGEYLGSTYSRNRNTTIYGPTGEYEGSIYRERGLRSPSLPYRFDRFDRFEREDD